MNAPAPPPFVTRAYALVVDSYFTVDRRTLALFRIVFGICLLGFLYDRTHGANLVAFFTDDGVFPVDVVGRTPIVPRSWSVLFVFSTQHEVKLAMLGIVSVYLLFIVGLYTRVMQWLIVVILVSLDNRAIMLESGGVVVAIIAAVFTAFLPLGDRFSIDALRRPRPETNHVARLAYGVLLLDFALIYALNRLQKNGATWRDGSVIHWVMWQNRLATPLAGWIRMHEPLWFSPLLAQATLVVEGLMPILILMPASQRWARRAAIILCVGLHTGIALLMVLGPFSYAMMSISVLLVGPEDWALVDRVLTPRLASVFARVEARLVRTFHPPMAPVRVTSARARWKLSGPWIGAIATAVITLAAGARILEQNWIIPQPLRVEHRPELLGAVSDYLRMGQGWMMFAPEAPTDDGTIVVDGRLADGSHVDPFTGKVPDFDQALHGPLDYGETWCVFFVRIADEGSRRLWYLLGDYIRRMDELPYARVRQPLESFAVYWVSNRSPPPGKNRPYAIRRRLLFTSGDYQP